MLPPGRAGTTLSIVFTGLLLALGSAERVLEGPRYSTLLVGYGALCFTIDWAVLSQIFLIFPTEDWFVGHISDGVAYL